MAPARSSTIRLIQTSMLLLLLLLAQQETFALSSYEIIAIEERPNGLLVATGDRHYALVHPSLARLGWHSISVNDEQAFIVVANQAKGTNGSSSINSSFSTKLSQLDDSSLDLIVDLRSNFISNLAQLRLADRPFQEENRGSSGGGTSWLAESQKSPAYPAKAAASSQSSGGEGGGEGAQLAKSAKRQRQQPTTSNYLPAAYHQRAESETPKGRLKVKPKHQSSSSYDLSKQQQQRQQQAPASASNNLNYYNLHQSGELERRLAGDVYQFGFTGNILDVFSSSVSIVNRANSLYRDINFFSFSRPALVSAVHRLFLFGEFVFFVYRDKTVLAKPVNSLDSSEAKLLASARATIRRLSQWQNPSSGRHIFSLPKPNHAKK